MYSRPSGYRNRSPSGKWQRLKHSGVGTVFSESDGGWEIVVTHRQAGTSIRRDIFGVTIRSQQPPHEEFLPAFSSKAAAIDAVRRRITLLSSVFEKAARRRKPKGRR